VSPIFNRRCVFDVNPKVPARTVPEFIAYAKANPGKINMAAVGIGSMTHVSGELFKMMAGIDLVTVQYRDPGPAHTDLITGQVDVMFDPLVSSIEQIKAGQLSTADFEKLIAEETEKWAKVVRAGNLKAE
jgi:tripartite-type tricarboxylate transporter receptor subunit TctC